MRVVRLLVGVLVVAVLLPVAAVAGWLWYDASRGNVGELSFRQPLAIPPMLDPATTQGGRRVFDLRADTGVTELLAGRRTPTWGVNGSYLGPTLRIRRGDRVRVNVHNGLPEPTTMHWHGMELPAASDGGPHQSIAPGTTWSPSWTVDQPAATLWYHPHPHGQTARHVYRGVAGLIYVNDATSARSGLPRRYGVDDIPLVVQDKNFTADGRLDETGISFGGRHVTGLLGEEILVNGTHDPYLTVRSRYTRFRVLNASTARVYDIGFTDDRPFEVVGTDTGLLPAPVATRRVMLSPGERIEIVARFRPSERVVLRSFPPELGGNPFYEKLAGGDDTFDLLQLRTAAELTGNPAPPRPLRSAPPITPSPDAPRRAFDLGDFTINGRTMDMDRIDFAATSGTAEVWRVRNTQGIPHNFHVHNAAFRVIDVDGRPPPAWQRGRKDTVYVPPGATVRFAVRFGPYPDRRAPYMFHCHLLAHEDSGMMGQFVLVKPGSRGRVGDPPGHYDHG
ncbi:MAG: multicopper oxidase family protein [Micromonosporaceae bacterium]